MAYAFISLKISLNKVRQDMEKVLPNLLFIFP